MIVYILWRTARLQPIALKTTIDSVKRRIGRSVSRGKNLSSVHCSVTGGTLENRAHLQGRTRG